MTDLFEPLPESAGTRRKENTRAKLVRASLDVFVEKGIDGVTVDDLVKAAGFTRGAFYSNFSSKEEVFIALFDEVTAELMAIANSSVESAVADVGADESCSILEADDAQVMLAVFEGIRPFGRQWYLLYSDAIARSLRDEALRAELAEQRERMRNQIGALLATRLEASGERALLPVEDLAQLLMGIFIDLLVREQLEGRDVTQLAATTILGTLRAFIAPKTD
ncbi:MULTISPECIES: TetR/AcrR family transcriptional regulator [Brachybacterium]|uniref:TetR/AcrR family transcriptional regulator n=2 Tax=Brachybacterium TaxID=43668 RepID=A0A3R8RSB2_9MICO|nr:MULTISPECIES: TetR/AcrR family transcriptional regulator [Brachybacterium]RRR19732.1 TetR/AcrR family transcriptional regulator [Brachybacterium paraconglomeratum]GLI31419.1 transcriptional regulator [Brachybacterium conglomeratum]GLK04331.1 transcriptional regulator [Brachybacterium conglomeratum]